MKKDKYLYRIDEIVDNYRNGLASIYELANIFRIQLDANRIQDYKVLECNAKRLEILDENKAERHIRGGMATKLKYGTKNKAS